MEYKSISTSLAPSAIGPYSQAVQVGNFLFCSGQIPLDPKSKSKSMEIIKGGVKEQTERVMENIGGVLKAAGLDFSNIVKSTLFILDMNQFQEVNEVYARYFKGNRLPARSCVAVKALPKGAQVEIEVLAYAGMATV